MGYKDTVKPPLYRHATFIIITCRFGQEPCHFIHAVQMCNFCLFESTLLSIAVRNNSTVSRAVCDQRALSIPAEHCSVLHLNTNAQYLEYCTSSIATHTHCTVNTTSIYNGMEPLYFNYSAAAIDI